MRYSSSLAVLPLAAQALQTAQDLDDNRFLQKNGISRYPITVAGGAPAKGLHKRQKEASLTPQKLGFFYTIDIEIGTPPQTVSVNFDTGSSELWVNPVCSKSSDKEFCETFGRYNESKTYVDAKAPGGVKYGTGYVDFEYGYDNIQIGSAKIKQQVFGVATDSEFAAVGNLGAGPSLEGWRSPYPFVIDTMAQQGVIQSRAFSLDIRSLGSDRGSVVFGGIDTKKFSGPLEKRPIIPAAESPDGFTRYWIHLDGIAITKEDGSNMTVFDQPNGQPVLLDSGYTLSALPGPIFNKILEAFPSARAESGSDEYFVDCSVAKSHGSIDFKFGKTVIKVPYEDFVWHQESGACKLGVTRDDGFPVLGDTFLRSAYAVFDWDNKNVHLANNEDCGSELIPIGKGVDAVPSVTGACGAPSSTISLKAPLVTASMGIAPLITAPLATAPLATAPLATAPLSTGPLVTDPSGAFGSKGQSQPSLWSNSTTAAPTLTSTFITTRVHTITSCAPTVTDCPLGRVSTEIITSYTTYCPVEGSNPTPTPAPTPTSQFAETTATYTIPRTYTCSKGLDTCTTQPAVHVITVSPIVTQTAPVEIPHYTTITDGETSSPIPTHLSASSSASEATSTIVPAMSSASTAIRPAPTGGMITSVATCSTCSVPGPSSVPTQGSPASDVPVAGASSFSVPGMILLAGALVAALV